MIERFKEKHTVWMNLYFYFLFLFPFGPDFHRGSLADTGFGGFPEWREANQGSPQVQLCNSLENATIAQGARESMCNVVLL